MVGIVVKAVSWVYFSGGVAGCERNVFSPCVDPPTDLEIEPFMPSADNGQQARSLARWVIAGNDAGRTVRGERSA